MLNNNQIPGNQEKITYQLREKSNIDAFYSLLKQLLYNAFEIDIVFQKDGMMLIQENTEENKRSNEAQIFIHLENTFFTKITNNTDKKYVSTLNVKDLVPKLKSFKKNV